jgi:hypothetical protein
MVSFLEPWTMGITRTRRRKPVRERFHGGGAWGGAEGLPHVSMGLGVRLESSSLPSSLPYLQTPNSGGAEDLAGWRGSVAGWKGSRRYFYLQHFEFGEWTSAKKFL